MGLERVSFAVCLGMASVYFVLSLSELMDF
uniref:Uncharacterized protein n=1 Tax=Anguilla anguilla TaxID=7936 RepID=A0A0E9UKV3_ANGAN